MTRSNKPVCDVVLTNTGAPRSLTISFLSASTLQSHGSSSSVMNSSNNRRNVVLLPLNSARMILLFRESATRTTGLPICGI